MVNVNVNVNRENRRFGRVAIEQGLHVTMNSIGSEVKYNMETKDISDTGFFLDFEKPGRFPFTPASIMEVWLELEKDNTVFFNGKMTRVVFPDAASEEKPGIAIRIVQIDSSAENTLREFIKKTVIARESEGAKAKAAEKLTPTKKKRASKKSKTTRKKAKDKQTASAENTKTEEVA